MKNLTAILAVFVIAATFAVYRSVAAPTRLQYVTTAHQAGPVGFRDPVGAVSPDGIWLAYVSNRHLFLHRIDNSSTIELPPADDNKTSVVWYPDSVHLAVRETPFNSSPRWFRYELNSGKRDAVTDPPNTAVQITKPVSLSEKIWGAAVFSPDRRTFYYSVANPRGTLDLWSRSLDSGERTQLTRFERDTYDPSVTAGGDLLFKSQVFNAFLGEAPAAGGPTRILTTFQSETPTWSPDGKDIAFTFGTWRRFIDDALYPNIAQDLGIVPFSQETVAQKPVQVFQASPSEDQGMVWSPNKKWIVFHSHRDNTDDLYLQLADSSQPPVQITKGGVETGWPRWSPDGRWIAYGSYPGDYQSTRGRLYVLGIDQETGKVTTQAAPVNIEGQTGTAGEPNWLPDSEHLVFDNSGLTPGRKSLAEVSRKGGRARKILDYISDQVFSGISTSPDGKWVAYVGTAPDSSYQIFRVPIRGGIPQQVTTDPNQKTQPAFSPDGRLVAFTIWRYDVQFWILRSSQ